MSVIVATAMSDELIALVRSAYEALNRRDFDGWMQQVDPQVEVYELAKKIYPKSKFITFQSFLSKSK
jgi:hypothetical protein